MSNLTPAATWDTDVAEYTDQTPDRYDVFNAVHQVFLNRTEWLKLVIVEKDGSGNVILGGGTARGAKLDVTGSIFQSAGTQFQITGTPGSKGLQLIGQDGTDCIVGTMGAGEDLVLRAGSSEVARVKQSNLCFLVTGGGALGYGPGSGDAKTQATNKFATVTINKPSGRITMNAAALAAGAVAYFTLSNSLIGAEDAPYVVIRGGQATPGTYNAWVDSVSAGSCVICLRNISGGSLSEAISLTFSLGKGSTT